MSILESWTEVLRCSLCASTSVATVSQCRSGAIVVQRLPVEFKLVSSQYGDTFYCVTCQRPARSQTS